MDDNHHFHFQRAERTQITQWHDMMLELILITEGGKATLFASWRNMFHLSNEHLMQIESLPNGLLRTHMKCSLPCERCKLAKD